ncbi:MAG: hypothetical protein JXR97_06030 [Planctomycetes bacterium]|nr:hypothetical protein [Planctomycetota bacterium]
MTEKYDQEEKSSAAPLGIQCPNCGCRDFSEEGDPLPQSMRRPRKWKTVDSYDIPHARRRRLICLYCGRRITTRETIEKTPDT